MEPFKVGDLVIDEGAIILDKYEVTTRLGEGGMGVVLAARRRRIGDLVALKFLRPSARENPDTVARFDQEARTAMRIDNDHVVRIIDVEEVGGVPFIVMEHLTGDTLASRIEQRGQLAVAESADLLLQACEAVHAAHALDIVHRDLKPSNLFIKSGPVPVVKVLDFGISKSTAGPDPSVTASSATLGSPQYMSPEQLLSSKSVDVRSDVWALGVILYEMVTGVPPFTGETVPAVTAAILGGQYVEARDIRPVIPPELEETIAGALALDRNARTLTVEAFAAQLARSATEEGRVSCERIQRAARGSTTPSEAPPGAGADSTPKASRRVAETADSVTITSDRELAGPVPPPARRRRGWTVPALAGLVATAGLAVAAPRLFAARAAAGAEPVPSASVAATSATVGSSASADPATPPPGAIANDGGVEDDVAQARAASAAPDDTQPDSHPNSIGAGAPGQPAKAVAVQPSRAKACASGPTPECQAACDNGSAAACRTLGVAYAKGDGVRQNLSKAMSLYDRGCELHDATACVKLGSMHFRGDGVEKNEGLGAKLYLQGCEGGSAEGCLDVSFAYGDGHGVSKKDPGQAMTYAQRACAGGYPDGCVRVQLLRIAGEGTDKDVQGGLAQLDGMCARKVAVACENLAALYDGKVSADVAADALRARDYLKKACDAGSQKACAMQGTLATANKAEGHGAQYNAWFAGQCDAGVALGCALLGEDLIRGVGIARDPVRGAALREGACKRGVARACGELEGGAP